MKAARYSLTDNGYVLHRADVATPTCRDNEVRLRVAFCGICGSDIARYRQANEPNSSLKTLFGTISYTQGHEISGVIDQIGSQVVEHWPDGKPVVGTRVAVHPLIGCGECAACRSREWNHCTQRERTQVIGVHRDGGFAEWVCVPFDHAIPASDATALDVLALTEPLAVAMHAVNVAQIVDYKTPIAIIGDGTLGLLIAQVLKYKGHQNLALIGHHADRLEIARNMGVHTLHTEQRSDHSRDELVGYAFQVAGSSTAIRLGVEMLAGNGQMICLGYLDAARDTVDPISINSIIRNEIILRGSFGSSRAEFQGALSELAKGQFDLSPFVGAKISLDDIVERGFEALLGAQRPVGKVLVQPGMFA